MYTSQMGLTPGQITVFQMSWNTLAFGKITKARYYCILVQICNKKFNSPFTIVDKLLKEEDTEKIYYIGNPNNLEAEIAKNYPQVEFLPVDVAGMPRKLTLSFFKS